MKISTDDLSKLDSLDGEFKRGCVVDTNTLFAASVPLDRLNEWAEDVFVQLSAHEISPYTNINIRHEFLDLQRRVLIPEGLVTLYDQADKESMGLHLKTQLKSLKTAKDESTKQGKLYKINEQQIKKYRSLLIQNSSPNAWEQFCETYVLPYLQDVWDATIEELKIKSFGTRAIDDREFFNSDPSWKDMVKIMGRFGVGSADAMIINFFLCSKFPLIVTGDEDVTHAVERLSQGKRYVLAP